MVCHGFKSKYIYIGLKAKLLLLSHRLKIAGEYCEIHEKKKATQYNDKASYYFVAFHWFIGRG